MPTAQAKAWLSGVNNYLNQLATKTTQAQNADKMDKSVREAHEEAFKADTKAMRELREKLEKILDGGAELKEKDNEVGPVMEEAVAKAEKVKVALKTFALVHKSLYPSDAKKSTAPE